MADFRNDAIERSRTALVALAVLRRHLEAAEAPARTVLSVLELGGSVSEGFSAARGRAHREDLTEAILEFEHQRRHARLALIALAKHEGMSNADVARLWGISPQWASKEAEAARDPRRFGSRPPRPPGRRAGFS